MYEAALLPESTVHVLTSFGEEVKILCLVSASVLLCQQSIVHLQPHGCLCICWLGFEPQTFSWVLFRLIAPGF